MSHREIALAFEPTSDPREVRIALRSGGRRLFTCFVRSQGPALRPCGEALLCFGLLPAIELGCDLRIEAAVDRDLLAGIDEVQRLVAGWAPGCRPVAIAVEAADPVQPTARGCGLFFSGGVDSAYSLATNRSRLDGLVTLIGCDVAVDDRERAAWLAALARRVAAAHGLESIVIETDLPARMHRYLGWIEYHGSALAGIRHLLADRFGLMLVAASADEATMWDTPWGSHPGLDPRLGTAAAAIQLDGLVTRPEKIARLVDEPALLADLRVCYHGGRNCGTCSKCVLTRTCLDVLGGGRPLPVTFAATPPLEPRVLRISDPSVRSERLVLRAAAASGGHDRLAGLLDAAVAEFDGRRPSFAERLRLKDRLRVARHRWRFRRDTGFL